MRRRSKFRKADNQQSEKKFKFNEGISASEVFLINEDGENVGVIATAKAIEMARSIDLDLVEVNPKADTPVAKILDLGQFKYEQEKKRQKQRVLQKKVEVKNVRLSFKISQHDLEVKLDQTLKFLSKGNKVKVDLNLRGRERQHFNKAKEMMIGFSDSLKERGEDLSIEEEQGLTRQPGGFTMILVNKTK